MDGLVGIATICRALKVTEKTVKSYMAREVDPLPVVRSGRRGLANKYDIGLCVEWLVRQKVSEVTGTGTRRGYEYERERLTKAQADKTELEAEVLRGNLIPVDQVVIEVSRKAAVMRARLLSIPTKVAAVAATMSEAEIQGLLADNISEALHELAREGLGGTRTAAEADSQPVGRRKPAAEPRGKRGARKVEH